MNFTLFTAFFIALANVLSTILKEQFNGISRGNSFTLDISIGLSILSLVSVPFFVSLWLFLSDGNNYWKKIKISLVKLTSEENFERLYSALRVKGEGSYCNQASFYETRHGPCNFYYFASNFDPYDDLLKGVGNHSFYIANEDFLRLIIGTFVLSADQDRKVTLLDHIGICWLKRKETIIDLKSVVLSKNSDFERTPLSVLSVDEGYLPAVVFEDNKLEIRFKANNGFTFKIVNLNELRCFMSNEKILSFDGNVSVNDVLFSLKINDSILETKTTIGSSSFSENHGEICLSSAIVLMEALNYWSRNHLIGVKYNDEVFLRRRARIFHVLNLRQIILKAQSGWFLTQDKTEFNININEGIIKHPKGFLEGLIEFQVNASFDKNWSKVIMETIGHHLSAEISNSVIMKLINCRDYLTTKNYMKKIGSKLPNWKFKRLCVDLNHVFTMAGEMGVTNIDKKIPVTQVVQGYGKHLEPNRKANIVTNSIPWKEVNNMYKDKESCLPEPVRNKIDEGYNKYLLAKAKNNLPHAAWEDDMKYLSIGKTRSAVDKLRSFLVDYSRSGTDCLGNKCITKEQVICKNRKTFRDALLNSDLGGKFIVRNTLKASLNSIFSLKKMEKIAHSDKKMKKENILETAKSKIKINENSLHKKLMRDNICMDIESKTGVEKSKFHKNKTRKMIVNKVYELSDIKNKREMLGVNIYDILENWDEDLQKHIATKVKEIKNDEKKRLESVIMSQTEVHNEIKHTNESPKKKTMDSHEFEGFNSNLIEDVEKEELDKDKKEKEEEKNKEKREKIEVDLMSNDFSNRTKWKEIKRRARNSFKKDYLNDLLTGDLKLDSKYGFELIDGKVYKKNKELNPADYHYKRGQLVNSNGLESAILREEYEISSTMESEFIKEIFEIDQSTTIFCPRSFKRKYPEF